MAVSPAAFAQYAGSVNDLNSVFNPPANIQGIICQYGTDQEKIVCRDGVSASRWIAEKYAQRAGQYLGCVDGFTQGINDGYNASKNASQDVIAEARAYVQGATMLSATSRANDRAEDTATTESADDLINRYRNVVGLNQLPDKTPKIPQIRFDGYSDGYSNDIQSGAVNGGSFNDAINAGYVTSSSKFEDKVAARAAYQFQQEQNKSLCDVNQTIFGRHSVPQLSIWDYFRKQRQNDFQKYGWKNGQWAFDVFTTDERNLDTYQNYEGLKNRTVTETVTTPVYRQEAKRDANGQLIPIIVTNADGTQTQQVGSDGLPMYEMQDVFDHNETNVVTRKVNAAELANLKAKYKQGFVDSYQLYYAKTYASIKYHTEGMAKYDHAKSIGKLIGKDVAGQVARKNAYDNRYREVSIGAFYKEVERLYMESFQELLAVFEGNAVIEINNGRIEGMIPSDNIFTAGEGVRAVLNVTNLGEQVETVQVRLGNSSGINSEATDTIRPESLLREDYVTKRLGSINVGVKPRSKVNTTVSVESPIHNELIQPLLNLSSHDSLLVRDYNEINSLEGSLDVLNGTVGATVELENPSDINSPTIVNVEISIPELGITDKKSGVRMPRSKKQQFRFDFSGLDPLNLIELQSVNVVIKVVRADGSQVEQKAITLRSNISRENAYPQLFNALANNPSIAQSKIDEVANKINQDIDKALKNKVRWNKQNQVNGTMLGKLQSIYKDQKASGKLTQAAVVQYDNLANRLAKKVLNKGKTKVRGGFLGIGRKKKFLKAVQVISPTLSIKWKDHK